jgi:hypothetical protein
VGRAAGGVGGPVGKARRVPDQDTPAAPKDVTQAAPKRGRADRTGASASANAPIIVCGWLARGHTMSKRAHGQVVGENGTCHGEKSTTLPTDTVKAWTGPPISDAFGINSLICNAQRRVWTRPLMRSLHPGT